MTDREFATREEAALAGWDLHPQAEASVVSVEYIDEREALVLTDTVPSHLMWNICFRTEGGWFFGGDYY